MTNKTSTASAKLSRKSSDVEISKFSLEEAGSDEELPQQETGLQEVVVFCHSSKLSAHAKLELHCSSSATVSDLISELILKFRDHNEEVWHPSCPSLDIADALPADRLHERALRYHQLPRVVVLRAAAGDAHQHRQQHDSSAQPCELVRWS
mmetsp:Transcript_25278/g.83542  ORF Transcript_25278/g.83542 Transcript_25278/m.83542 type:complete len:151 (-) Transcript_25278:248-700(-)